MVVTTMSTFASLTVHCARCHDHKFDPIPQEDYYRLQAVFAGVDRADQTYFDADVKRKRDEVHAQVAASEAEQRKVTDECAALTSPELAALDARTKALTDELSTIPDPFAPSEQAASSPTQWLSQRDRLERQRNEMGTGRFGAIRGNRRGAAGAGRPTDFRDTPGFGFPARFRVAVSSDPTFATQDVIADHLGEDFANPGLHPFSVAPQGVTGRYIRVTAEKLWPRSSDFVFALGELQVESAGRNIAAGTAVTALDTIEAGRWGTKNLVDGFGSRHQLPDVAAPATAAALARRQTLERELDQLHTEHARVAETLVPAELKQQSESVDQQLADLRKRLEKLDKGKQVYALKSHEPREIQLLRRGDVKSPAGLLAPGSLGCLPGLPREFALADPHDEGERRAALAKWIVDPANVLTWRSIVNRVWQYHFGAGLVDTPSDFGRMGSQPSHPELLDWLALEFRERGESLKALHKLIVTSAVYRQSSVDDEANNRLDAANRFLWRQNRRRLDAEAVRDAELATSGKLDLTMHGPSARQFAFKDDHSPIYDYARFDVDDPDAYRRSVYRFIVRSVPDPLMECLDCADPSLLTPKRNTTLTALRRWQ